MNQEKKILTNELKRIPGFYINANMIDKIILIAEMYYSYGLSQMEIAEKLEISRPWVSKLLNRALEMGFVRIEVISQYFFSLVFLFLFLVSQNRKIQIFQPNNHP